jgi:hypothetical protein
MLACFFYFSGTSQAGNLQANTRDASRLIDQIAGVYRSHHKAFDGTGTALTEDILEIVKVNENTIYFKVRLQFDYCHSCSLFGTAYATKDKAFLFTGNKEFGECKLKIVPSDKKITFVDGTDGGKECKDVSCGNRGRYVDASFKRSLRRPIKYMKILKDSTDYQQSIMELTNK